MLIELPDAVSPASAAGVPDNVSDGYRCVAKALRNEPGADVLVVGGLAQSVGLYAVAAAIALGASRVHYVDQDPDRLHAADTLGATTERCALDDLRAHDHYAITVDASALEAGRNHALRSTRRCGHCTSVTAGIAASATMPLQSMYLRGISYDIGRVHARSTAPDVLALIEAGALDPLGIPHRVVDITDAVDALIEPSIKVIFGTS